MIFNNKDKTIIQLLDPNVNLNHTEEMGVAYCGYVQKKIENYIKKWMIDKEYRKQSYQQLMDICTEKRKTDGTPTILDDIMQGTIAEKCAHLFSLFAIYYYCLETEQIEEKLQLFIEQRLANHVKRVINRNLPLIVYDYLMTTVLIPMVEAYQRMDYIEQTNNQELLDIVKYHFYTTNFMQYVIGDCMDHKDKASDYLTYKKYARFLLDFDYVLKDYKEEKQPTLAMYFAYMDQIDYQDIAYLVKIGYESIKNTKYLYSLYQSLTNDQDIVLSDQKLADWDQIIAHDQCLYGIMREIEQIMKSLRLEYKGKEFYQKVTHMVNEFDVVDYKNMPYYQQYVLKDTEQHIEIDEDEGEYHVV